MLNPEGRHGKLRLDKNEHITGLPEQLVHDALSNVNPETISSYPEVRPLYQKLAKSLKISEDNLMLSAGSDPAIKSLYELFVKEGDHVILQKPTYAMFHVYAEMFGAISINIEYDSKLNFDTDLLLNKISDEVQMIAIANPNSPTGCVIEEKLLEQIIKKAANSGVVVLIDEAYYPFYEKTMISYINNYENLVISRTFSKAYGLAGLRLGYLAGNKKLIQLVMKVRPMYEITGVAAHFGCYILDHENLVQDYVEQTKEGKNYLVQEFKKLGYESYPTEANFIQIKIPDRKLRTLIQSELLKHDILISNNQASPIENCIRLSIGPVKEMIKVIKEIKKVISLNK